MDIKENPEEDLLLTDLNDNNLEVMKMMSQQVNMPP